jgi:hypothetical protein
MGGLALFVKKTLPYSWEHVVTDNSNFQVCVLRFNNEECVIANVYVPPKCADASELILSPLLDILSRYTVPCFVGGDFNARVGDATMVDVDDEHVSYLPSINLDRATNENRASFLSFVEATDLRVLNGFVLNPQGHNPPATFTFSSIRALPPPAPPGSGVVAQSCVDYILASPSVIAELSPLSITWYPKSEHASLSTRIPYFHDLHPAPPATPLLKFYPPEIEATLTIFRNFDLSAIPPDAHPITYLTDQIHAHGSWKPRPTPRSWFETPETKASSQQVARLRTEARKYH